MPCMRATMTFAYREMVKVSNRVPGGHASETVGLGNARPFRYVFSDAREHRNATDAEACGLFG